MDSISYDIMKWMTQQLGLEDKQLEILDIGADDLNGSYRPLFSNPKWKYTGIDLTAGKNVDIILVDPYQFPFEDSKFDLVVSGQCLEHVEDIYAWADEAIRVLKPGGRMCIIAPASWQLHAFPYDCWRFMPDGFRFLFVKRTKKLKEQIIGVANGNIDNREGHCYGIFKKE